MVRFSAESPQQVTLGQGRTASTRTLRHCRRAYRPTLRRVCRLLYPLISEDSATQWIHAAAPGEYLGHPAGPFTLDATAFRQILENFNRRRNKVIPLTFDHPVYDGNPVEQAGWVHELDVRDNGLWALAEFTSKAAELVRGGSYKFCSVVVDLESIDKRTAEEIGVELHELAICGAPFIDGLEPIKPPQRNARCAPTVQERPHAHP